MSNNNNTSIEDDGWGRSEPVSNDDCNDFNGDKNKCNSYNKCKYNESNSKCSKKRSVSFSLGGKKRKTRRRALNKRSLRKKNKTKRKKRKIRRKSRRGGTRKDRERSLAAMRDKQAIRPPPGTHPDKDLFKGYKLEDRPVWPTAVGEAFARQQGYRIQDEGDL